MQHHPMPWSFKATVAALGIFAIGAGLIVFAHFQDVRSPSSLSLTVF